MARWAWLGLGLVTLAGTAGLARGADDQEVALSSVPSAALKAAQKAEPGVKWAKAWKSAEPGPASFEIEGTDAEGDDVGVTVTAEGKVTEVEREVEMAKVPKVVRSALKAKYPRFKSDEAFTVRQDGKTIGYRFEGKQGAEELDLYVTADGKTVEED